MEKLRLILVEDNENLRISIIEILKFNFGNKIDIVGEADTEEKALKLLETKEYDVMIIDVMLAEGNGLSVLKKASPLKTGIWIVFSGHNQYELGVMCRAEGADHVLDKSNDIESLIRILSKILNVPYAESW